MCLVERAFHDHRTFGCKVHERPSEPGARAGGNAPEDPEETPEPDQSDREHHDGHLLDEGQPTVVVVVPGHGHFYDRSSIRLQFEQHGRVESPSPQSHALQDGEESATPEKLRAALSIPDSKAQDGASQYIKADAENPSRERDILEEETSPKATRADRGVRRLQRLNEAPDVRGTHGRVGVEIPDPVVVREGQPCDDRSALTQTDRKFMRANISSGIRSGHRSSSIGDPVRDYQDLERIADRLEYRCIALERRANASFLVPRGNQETDSVRQLFPMAFPS